MQSQSTPAPLYCAYCAAPLYQSAQFCSKCGQPVQAQSGTMSVSNHLPDSKKRAKNLFGCAFLTVIGLMLLFAFLATSRQYDRQRPSEVAALNAVSENSDTRMRRTFDNLEQIAVKYPSLWERVRALRLEWEEGKNDPQKLEVIQRKIDLLMKGIKDDRY